MLCDSTSVLSSERRPSFFSAGLRTPPCRWRTGPDPCRLTGMGGGRERESADCVLAGSVGRKRNRTEEERRGEKRREQNRLFCSTVKLFGSWEEDPIYFTLTSFLDFHKNWLCEFPAALVK